MKITLCLKDPDGIWNFLHEQISDEELRDGVEHTFFDCGDYVYLEIDTESMTGRVQPREEWRKSNSREEKGQDEARKVENR